jgi:hypothetical protein
VDIVGIGSGSGSVVMIDMILLSFRQILYLVPGRGLSPDRPDLIQSEVGGRSSVFQIPSSAVTDAGTNAKEL